MGARFKYVAAGRNFEGGVPFTLYNKTKRKKALVQSESHQSDPVNGFSIGAIDVTPQHNQIGLAGRQVRLQPKVMAVLCYLAKHSAQVTSVDQLLDAVWEGRVVTQSSVQKAINALRSALSELDSESDYIQHYSKRGYQINPQLPLVFKQRQSHAHDELAPPRHRWSRRRVAQLLGGGGLLALVILAFVWLFPVWPPVQQASLPPAPKAALLPTKVVQFPFSEGNGTHLTLNPQSTLAAYSSVMAHNGQVGLYLQKATLLPWQVSVTDGLWVDLAWSPSGRSLAAVELWKDDEVAPSSYFYQRPVHFFNIQIFTFDFKGLKVIETNRLSQWHGEIFSLTWWDENTLEFVATQGLQQSPERYRYHVPSQSLSKLPKVAKDFVVKKSRVYQQNTALLGQGGRGAELKLLGPSQNILAEFALASHRGEVSWGRDGIQVLLFQPTPGGNQYQASLMNISGEQTSVFFSGDNISSKRLNAKNLQPQTLHSQPEPAQAIKAQDVQLKPNEAGKHRAITRAILSPRINATYVETQPAKTGLLWQALPHQAISPKPTQEVNLLEQIALDGLNGVQLSPDGRQMMATATSAKPELFLLEFGSPQTHAIELPAPLQVHQLAWDHQYKTFIVHADSALWQVDKNTPPVKIQSAPSHLKIFWVGRSQQRLLVMDHSDKKRNIGAYAQDQYKPLTFGSIGAAIGAPKGVYFQYVSQKGLWLIDADTLQVQQVNASLPENVELVHVDSEYLYYVTGGPCFEQEIFQFHLKSAEQTKMLTNLQRHTQTLAFHPTLGRLARACE